MLPRAPRIEDSTLLCCCVLHCSDPYSTHSQRANRLAHNSRLLHVSTRLLDLFASLPARVVVAVATRTALTPRCDCDDCIGVASAAATRRLCVQKGDRGQGTGTQLKASRRVASLDQWLTRNSLFELSSGDRRARAAFGRLALQLHRSLIRPLEPAHRQSPLQSPFSSPPALDSTLNPQFPRRNDPQFVQYIRVQYSTGKQSRRSICTVRVPATRSSRHQKSQVESRILCSRLVSALCCPSEAPADALMSKAQSSDCSPRPFTFASGAMRMLYCTLQFKPTRVHHLKSYKCSIFV